MKFFRMIVMPLLVVGALNWGGVGFFRYDLIGAILGGETTMLARFVYSLIGLAGLYSLGLLCRSCCCCWVCGAKGCSFCKKEPK